VKQPATPPIFAPHIYNKCRRGWHSQKVLEIRLWRRGLAIFNCRRVESKLLKNPQPRAGPLRGTVAQTVTRTPPTATTSPRPKSRLTEVAQTRTFPQGKLQITSPICASPARDEYTPPSRRITTVHIPRRQRHPNNAIRTNYAYHTQLQKSPICARVYAEHTCEVYIDNPARTTPRPPTPRRKKYDREPQPLTEKHGAKRQP